MIIESERAIILLQYVSRYYVHSQYLIYDRGGAHIEHFDFMETKRVHVTHVSYEKKLKNIAGNCSFWPFLFTTHLFPVASYYVSFTFFNFTMQLSFCKIILYID